MPYQFAGFFARASVPIRNLPPGASCHEITEPFLGIGVRLPSLVGKTPAQNEIHALASELGINTADSWLYLAYDTWGGDVDFVYGFTSLDGVASEPVEDSSQSTAESTYLALMKQFGVAEECARSFQPFARGFWKDDA